MRRRLSSVAITIGALLLDTGASSHYRAHDVEDARLERLTACADDPRDRGSVAPVAPNTSAYEIPLSGDRRHLIVNVTLNGIVTGPMLIDTGASYCVVTRGTASKLGIPPRSHRTIPVATANGRVDADFVAIDALKIYDAILGDVDAVIMDAVEPPLIGIIGLNFLTQFRFSVDLARGTLRLESE